MDEGDGIEDTFGIEYAGGTQQYTRSFSPSNLQLPADFISTQRLDRESSLEAVPQPSGSVYIVMHNLMCMYMCVFFNLNCYYTCCCHLFILVGMKEEQVK